MVLDGEGVVECGMVEVELGCLNGGAVVHLHNVA